MKVLLALTLGIAIGGTATALYLKHQDGELGKSWVIKRSDLKGLSRATMEMLKYTEGNDSTHEFNGGELTTLKIVCTAAVDVKIVVAQHSPQTLLSSHRLISVL